MPARWWSEVTLTAALLAACGASSPSGAQECLRGVGFPGEFVVPTRGTADQDGLTSEQRAALQSVSVDAFAMPMTLPEDMALAAVVVSPAVNELGPCIQLVFSEKGE